MPRLLVLTTIPCARDPRAGRAAAAAAELGWEVVGAAVSHAAARPALSGTGRARHALRRLRGLYRPAKLLLATARLVRAARASRPTVVHANDLDTLPAGWWLARRHSARLVYDAHELYSGFESDPPRLWSRLSLALEGVLARRADAVVTVSEPIANELTRRLRLRRPPLVVLNCPPLEQVEVEARPGLPVRAIYQAAVGPGRMLEDVVEAARASPGVEVTVRLLGGEGASLASIRVEPPVPPDRLVEALAPYDIGLVIDRPDTENARLALPNKLFEYLMAGLAVAVPRAPAMAALVEEHGVGVVYERGALGEALARLASDRGQLDEMRRRARELALTRFNAEAQRPALHEAWGL